MAAPELRILTISDLKEVSELQAKVWQDYFLAERGLQVPLLYRTEKNLRYYMAKEQEGCFVAEVDGQLVGCIFSHVWGSVGWFGPVEVATEHQNRGIGKELVTRSVNHLKSRGCETIGLETMSSSHKNITMYAKLGFMPKHLSYVLFKRLHEPTEAITQVIETEQKEDLPVSKQMWNSIIPGLDYSTEIRATAEHNLGKHLLYESDVQSSHAIVHTYEMFDNSPNAVVKLMVAGDVSSASALLDQCENAALERSKNGIFLRTYAAARPSLEFFLERGYVLQSTSTRMILQGQDEEGTLLHVSCWSG